MDPLFWPALLIIGAGASVFVQQVLNAHLKTELGSTAWSGVTSYFIGLLFMVCLAFVLRDPVPTANTVSRVPWWAWSGGVFGAIFIALAIVTIPKLGGAGFIALLVAGQMFAGLAFDRFGWLGIPERPIDLPRVLGVALLVAGVILIRR